MKTVFFRVGLMFSLAMTATMMLLAPRCTAQSEVDPDHFDGTDAWAGAIQTPQPAKPALSASKAVLREQSKDALLAKIPFAFTAGRMVLPAGEYRVEKSSSDSVILLIEGTDRSSATFVSSIATQAKAPQTKSKLVFHRYGNRYFLSQVWTAGNPRGRELPKSPKEKEALLARNEAPASVTTAASLASPLP